MMSEPTGLPANPRFALLQVVTFRGEHVGPPIIVKKPIGSLTVILKMMAPSTPGSPIQMKASRQFNPSWDAIQAPPSAASMDPIGIPNANIPSADERFSGGK